MPTSNPHYAPAPEQRLTRIFAQLCSADRHALLAFAEFLAAGGHADAGGPSPAGLTDQAVIAPPEPSPEPIPEPTPRPRPERESVIAAIRRLALTYPMLDRDPMLHQTAALMSAHVLHGRTAAAVIDELEALFLRQYQDACARRAAAPGDGPRAGA
jgi:hypothetical protein